MAVTVNATASAATGSYTTPSGATNANLTIVSGATVLLAWVAISYTGTAPASVVVNWDNTGSPQAMTQLITVTGGASANWTIASLYGLLNPTVGNKTFSIAWTNAGTGVCVDLIAFNGTASDTLANAFQNPNTNTGTTTSAAITGTSATNNINVGLLTSRQVNVSAFSATGSTLVSNNNSYLGCGFARAPGAATVAWSGTLASALAWAAVCIDVCVPVAQPSLFPPFLQLQSNMTQLRM